MRRHRALEAWCLLAHLEPGIVCMPRRWAHECGTAEPRVFRDRVLSLGFSVVDFEAI